MLPTPLRLPLIAALAAGLSLTAPALAQEAETVPLRTITVTGEGRITAVPDLARIAVGVETQAKDASEALRQNSQRMAALVGVLDELGVDARDRQTSQISLQPEYDYQNGRSPTLRGYRVSNTLNLRLRDIAAMGTALDALVAAGGTTIQNIAFEISDADSKLDEARTAAVEDARRKASLYAEAAGASLGDVITISEGGGVRPPQPVMMRAMALDEAQAVPVEAGEQSVSVRVSTQWTLD